MNCVFIVALIRKDNSIVDIAWGIGFICVAVVTYFLHEDMTIRSLLMTVLVSVWGIRLAVHVGLRNKGKPEDFRYAKWRKQWGKWFVPRSYLQIFLLQGILLLIISYPVQLVNRSETTGLTVLDLMGVLIWCVGFYFESVSDYQLVRFKRNPENKGKIMTIGLWKYSRHPNYFGEVLLWWGIFVIALSVEFGWTAIVSPLLITFLLLRVSGVTMLEKKYVGNEAYAAYAKKTSVFIPLPPKAFRARNGPA
jgi:steroid 5-alpha reductase family enzyme